MPYRLQSAGGNTFYVVSDSGKRRSKRPLPHKRALAQLRALYANDAHVRTKAAIDALPATCTLDDLYTYAVRSGTSYQQEVAEAIVARVPNFIALKGEQIAPGVTRIRGNLCNVHGRYGPCDAAQGARATIDRNKRINAQAAQGGGKGGRKGKRTRKAPKPKKTNEQRAQEREQERQKNRDAVKQQMADNDAGLSPSGFDALSGLMSGEQPTGVLGKGLVERGLAEQASDGSYRITPSGRVAMNAASAGDYQRAVDGIHRAQEQAGAKRERTSAREQAQRQRAVERAKRLQEREARRQQVEQRRAEAEQRRQERQGRGGGGKKTEPKKEETVSRRKPSPSQSRGTSRSPSSGSSASAIGRRAEARRRREERVQREAARQIERAIAAQQRQEEQARRAADQAERSRVTTPEIAGVAKRLSEGGEISEVEANTLIRNGLARRDRDGTLVLTGTGLRTARQKEAQSFAVFKDASGHYRWILRTTTAYRDRDREILSLKSLEADAERMTATGQYGPLRYWHVGSPDPFHPAAPWGPGIDLGMCDYSVVIGRTAIESGTFFDGAIGVALSATAKDYEGSPGFFHPAGEPDAEGVFWNTRRFERSLVPVRFARASNLFTGFAVGKATKSMDPQEYERRVKAFLSDMQGKGVPPEAAAAVIAQQQHAEKAATDQQIAYKSEVVQTDVMPGQRFKTANGEEYIRSPSELDPNGIYYAVKAAPTPAAEDPPAPPTEEKAEMMEGMEEDAATPYFSPEELQEIAAAVAPVVAAAVVEQLSPALNIETKMRGLVDELKSIGASVSMQQKTKEETDAAEIAALKEQIETTTKTASDLSARLAELEGDQPRSVKTGFRASLQGPVADATTLKDLNVQQPPPAGAFDDINQFLLGANGATQPR